MATTLIAEDFLFGSKVLIYATPQSPRQLWQVIRYSQDFHYVVLRRQTAQSHEVREYAMSGLRLDHLLRFHAQGDQVIPHDQEIAERLAMLACWEESGESPGDEEENTLDIEHMEQAITFLRHDLVRTERLAMLACWDNDEETEETTHEDTPAVEHDTLAAEHDAAATLPTSVPTQCNDTQETDHMNGRELNTVREMNQALSRYEYVRALCVVDGEEQTPRIYKARTVKGQIQVKVLGSGRWANWLGDSWTV